MDYGGFSGPLAQRMLLVRVDGDVVYVPERLKERLMKSRHMCGHMDIKFCQKRMQERTRSYVSLVLGDTHIPLVGMIFDLVIDVLNVESGKMKRN